VTGAASSGCAGWCEGFPPHAVVVIAEHDHDALERLCSLSRRMRGEAVRKLHQVPWLPLMSAG
jgi:hypothetical protein